ncbi:hypothetical protein D021_1114A, partial [Vibrio parahaemolyticus 10296]
MEDIQWL